MTHPQNSPRGTFAKDRVEIGAADLTADSTGNLVVAAGVTIGALSTITVDSTGNLMFGESYLAMTSVAPA